MQATTSRFALPLQQQVQSQFQTPAFASYQQNVSKPPFQLLKEWCDKRGFGAPLDEYGLGIQPPFNCTIKIVQWGQHTGSPQNSKQEAKHQAAAEIISKIKAQHQW